MPDWRQLSWVDRLAWVIGTGFGSGFSPIAPGTAGSAAAGAIFAVTIVSWGEPVFGYLFLLVTHLLVIAIAFPAGVWATGRMSTAENPDPGTAVWDEFVGMWVSCLPITLLAWFTGLLLQPYWIVLPFIFFERWTCSSHGRVANWNDCTAGWESC